MATLASTVGPILIAGMLETYHSWTINFGFIALCFFIGAVTYTSVADTRNLDRPQDEAILRSKLSPEVTEA